MGTPWKPSATPARLTARAALLAQIRQFFADREVLEVQTPVLAAHGVTDPQIPQWRVESAGRWLQTSPEYAMKRLLAAGVGDCYQITPAFRAAEHGRLHNPEFTLLEWYRTGFDAPQLMAEVTALINQVLGYAPIVTRRYADAFIDSGLPDPLSADETALWQAAADHQLTTPAPDDLDRDGLLDWLLSTQVIPQLPRRCFITHYPASQAVLARLSADDTRVAERFELFCDGVELVNGFDEITDPKALAARWQQDQAKRAQNEDALPAVDERLLGAMASGLPDCAGVALGVDRLFMLAEGLESIGEGLAFDWDNA